MEDNKQYNIKLRGQFIDVEIWQDLTQIIPDLIKIGNDSLKV